MPGNLSIRNLGRAAAVSLLLHLILLWPQPAAQRADGASSRLTARLTTAAAPADPAPPAAVAMPPTTPVPQPAASERSAKLPLQRSSPTAPSLAVTAPAPEQTVGSTAASDVRSDASPVAISHRRDAAAAPSPADGKPGDGLNADGMREYRVALARETRRYRDYPSVALAAGLGGRADVRVEVAAAGRSEMVTLEKSSGDGRLDTAALDMVRRAAPAARVPDSLRGRAFVVTVPMVFDPRD